jgi:hypothetical protein
MRSLEFIKCAHAVLVTVSIVGTVLLHKALGSSIGKITDHVSFVIAFISFGVGALLERRYLKDLRYTLRPLTD